MKRIFSVIARILILGALVFPVCPMAAQAHGMDLTSHASMHGMPNETDHEQISTQVQSDVCCTTATVIAPAIESKNGFAMLQLPCVTVASRDSLVLHQPHQKISENDTGPPESKFEKRSTNKRE